MNDRIQLLIEQATTRIDPTAHDGVCWDFDKEKFAELIVAECMEQINKVEEKGDAHLGGGYFYDGTRLCRDAIKQHFGVEE